MEERKARLAALAAKAGRVKLQSTNNDESHHETTKVLSFRNYTPSDPTLDSTTATSDEPASKRIKQEQSALEQALAIAKTELPNTLRDNDDLIAAAPKKINADLKRDIRLKLEKLERRTQKAIVALLRERLEKEADAGLD